MHCAQCKDVERPAFEGEWGTFTKPKEFWKILRLKYLNPPLDVNLLGNDHYKIIAITKIDCYFVLLESLDGYETVYLRKKKN